MIPASGQLPHRFIKQSGILASLHHGSSQNKQLLFFLGLVAMRMQCYHRYLFYPSLRKIQHRYEVLPVDGRIPVTLEVNMQLPSKGLCSPPLPLHVSFECSSAFPVPLWKNSLSFLNASVSFCDFPASWTKDRSKHCNSPVDEWDPQLIVLGQFVLNSKPLPCSPPQSTID